jgi:hypothetical protein
MPVTSWSATARDRGRGPVSCRCILEKMGDIADGLPERWALEDAHDKATQIEVAATVKLRKIQPTTIAGVMAVTAYFAEHMDRYPGCGWIGGENHDDACWFGDGLILNLAAALAKINKTAVA